MKLQLSLARIAVLLLILVTLMSSCAADEYEHISVTALVVYDQRIDEHGCGIYLFLLDSKSSETAVISIPEMLVYEGSRASEAVMGTEQEMLDWLGALLGIPVKQSIVADSVEAQALFTILDSLSSQEISEDQGYLDRFDLRWRSLYENARLLGSEAIIEKVFAVTDGQISSKKVKQALEVLGNTDGMPYIIEMPITLDHQPLYQSAYGKELIVDVMYALSTSHRE